MTMKRLIAAVSFALITAPAFSVEIGKPYEQVDVDRALPNISESRTQVAASGATRSDREIATDERGGSVWAQDHNFIAPAQ
jgi:hypothetical protein